MTRYIKRGGKVWIKIFPDKPVTEKPAEPRMGSGTGSPEYWVAVVKPGRVLFEIADVSEETAREACLLYTSQNEMQQGIIGTKMGMTQIFDENGKVVPVTVVDAGPCTVVQLSLIHIKMCIRDRPFAGEKARQCFLCLRVRKDGSAPAAGADGWGALLLLSLIHI